MSSYTVQLSQFEGPLDVLLHLVSRAKVDIADIFISEITEQFLAAMDQVEQLDMDVASEFIQMAATLLEIKSRALLPKPPPLEEDEEDPEEALIRRLEEYRQFKEASERLQTLEQTAVAMLYRLPEEIVTGQRIELTGMTLEGLVAAFAAVLRRARTDAVVPEVAFIEREVWTVQECMFRIQARLREGDLMFEELFGERTSRAEVVSVFVALLELCKLGRVRITQEATHGPIVLSKGGAEDGSV